MSNLYAEIRKKQDLLFDRYGGMLGVTQLMEVLGCSRKTAIKWAELHRLGTPVCGRIKYETDQVAKAIVSERGMVRCDG